MEPNNPELLVMTVDIGDGRQDVIRIRQCDDPIALARAFADKHQLQSHLRDNLATLVAQNKELASLRPESSRNSNGLEQSRGPIQERLFQQKQRAARPVAVSKSKSAANVNYGEWLYLKGTKMQETRQQKAEQAAQARQVAERAEIYTFRPQINEYSSLLAPRYFEKTEDLLLKKAADVQERKEALRASAEQQRMAACTFAPKVLNTRSHNASRDSSAPKHEALFSDAECRRQKREQVSEESFKLNYTFKPSINASRATVESQEDHADRLIALSKQQQLNREKAREEAWGLGASARGKPQLRDSHLSDAAAERRSGQPVHDYLYAKKDERHLKMQKKTQQRTEELQDQMALNRPSEQSLKVLDQFRGKQYAKIFSVLDSDCDGYITSGAIALDVLDNKTLEILTPVFKVLDEGAELDIAGFVSLMEELWRVLGPEQKGHIFTRGPKPTEQLQGPKSLLSSNSSKLADNKRTYSEKDLYGRLTNAHRLSALKLAKEQELIQQSTMQQCTFKPDLKKGPTRRK